MYVLLNVDDILIVGTNELEVENLKKTFNLNFKMKNLGEISTYFYYLGIHNDYDLKQV